MKTDNICYKFMIIIICFYVTGANAKQHYDLKVDDLMNVLLTDVVKGKFKHRFPTRKITTELSPKSIQNTVPTKLPYVRTTHVIPLAKLSNNMSAEDFFLRKRYLDIRAILESNVTHVPNFNSEEDDISLQTRRFNGIKNLEPKEALREVYFAGDNVNLLYKEKTQVINLMAQFVYETRYHLPYAQKLRKKYRKHVNYQLGYCFALIRNLKLQQKVVYSTLKNFHGRGGRFRIIRTLYTHIKFYEKILKLDVDIKDMIKLILKLDKRRKLLTATTMRTRATRQRP